jgi:3',5'-cyclic-AMP phosphodiesterase
LNLSRRNVLSATLSGLLAPSLSFGSTNSTKRVLKVAYLTDIHLPNDPVIRAKATKAIQRANRSDIVFFGGDNLMAIDHKPAEDVAEQMKGWEALLREHLKKPYHCILGNHDIEQWQLKDETLLNGKRRSLELFNMKDRFWSFESQGWRFVGLDTVHREGEKYKGFIDPEQFEWLERTLTKDTTPTMVMGHMPLLTVTGLADSGMKVVDGFLKISQASHVGNGSQVAAMFRKAGNVKLAMSGHIHSVDQCEFGGTNYVCAGAVCGGWWNGMNEGFGPSLYEIDLMSNGSFVSQRVEWEV